MSKAKLAARDSAAMVQFGLFMASNACRVSSLVRGDDGTYVFYVAELSPAKRAEFGFGKSIADAWYALEAALNAKPN